MLSVRVRHRVLLSLGAVVVLAGSLAGCSSGDGNAAPGPGAASATGNASDAATAAERQSPTESAAPGASCSVRGFHPSTRITARRARPVVVYAVKYSLPPGVSTHSPNHVAHRLDPVPLGVRVRPDAEARPTTADRDGILGSAGGSLEGGTIPDTVRLAVNLHNRSHQNRSYLVYRGALAWSGTWTMRECGAPYADGSSVSTLTGTYDTLGPLGPARVATCGVAPRHPDAVARRAAERACE